MIRRLLLLFALGLLAHAAGCSPGVNTNYGRVRGTSVNGTGLLSTLVKAQGHEVRTALRLTEELGQWADVIVRFAPYPGPPDTEEAAWYGRWLDDGNGERLLYVPNDYNAEPEYWGAARDQLPTNSPDRLLERINENVERSRGWADRLPPAKKEVVSQTEWFGVKASSKTVGARKPVVCKKLGGPWAKGLDASAVSLVRDDAIQPRDPDDVLLTGDGEALVSSWTRPSGGQVMVVASGNFLLNAAIVTHPARRPLVRRVVRWIGGLGDADDADEPQNPRPIRVAFVEGQFVTGEAKGPPSVFDLLFVEPFGRVAAQLLALGLIGCLARAPRLGRARPAPATDAERPVAHPEALGALLARTTQAREARSLLETYRRWRAGPGRGGTHPG